VGRPPLAVQYAFRRIEWFVQYGFGQIDIVGNHYRPAHKSINVAYRVSLLFGWRQNRYRPTTLRNDDSIKLMLGETIKDI
jgi:hypothetical protein